MPERIIFGTSVEGMLRALGPLTTDVKADLIALGVNPDKLLPGYSVDEYIRLLNYIGQRRFPALAADARDRELGREFIRGFSQTFVGKATLAMFRVIGPMRSTLRMTRTMRTVTNYSTAEADTLDEKSVRLRCFPVARPWYYVGVFEEAGQKMYGPSYTVQLERVDAEHADFIIRW